MKTVTQDQFKNMYGQEVVSQFKATPVVSTKQPLVSPENVAQNRQTIKEGAQGLYDTYSQYPSKVASDISEGAKNIQQGFQSGDPSQAIAGLVKGTTKTAARLAGDTVGTIYAPVGAAIGTGLKLTGAQKVIDWLGNTIADKSGLTDIPEIQQLAMKHPNAGEDFGRALNIILGNADNGKIEPRTMIERTKNQIKGALPSGPSGGIPNPIEGVKNTFNSAVSKGEGAISGIKEKATNFLETPTPKPVVTALKETKSSTFDEYANAARKATESNKNATPLELAGKKAQGALDTIQRKLKATGEQKSTVINQAAVGNKPVGNIVVKFRQNLSNYLRDKTAVEGDSKLFRDINSEATKLGSNPSAKQVDKFIDFVQDKIYTAGRDLTVPITDSATAALRQLTGQLNESLKSQLPDSYRGLNARASQLYDVRNELNTKLGKEGEKGGALMKRVFSPSDANTKKLFEDVKVYSGVDLVNEATVARYMMETMGDARQASLLERLQLPSSLSKKGLVDYLTNKIVSSVNSPEAQLKRAREFTMPDKPNMQGGFIKNPFGGNDIPANDWKFLANFAEKVKGREAVTKSDYEMVKAIFKENGLKLPNTPRKTADYINSVDMQKAQTEMDNQLNAGLKSP